MELRTVSMPAPITSRPRRRLHCPPDKDRRRYPRPYGHRRCHLPECYRLRGPLPCRCQPALQDCHCFRCRSADHCPPCPVIHLPGRRSVRPLPTSLLSPKSGIRNQCSVSLCSRVAMLCINCPKRPVVARGGRRPDPSFPDALDVGVVGNLVSPFAASMKARFF